MLVSIWISIAMLLCVLMTVQTNLYSAKEFMKEYFIREENDRSDLNILIVIRIFCVFFAGNVVHLPDWYILAILQKRNRSFLVLATGQNQQLYKLCFHPPIYSGPQDPGKEKKPDTVKEKNLSCVNPSIIRPKQKLQSKMLFLCRTCSEVHQNYKTK